MSGDIPTWTIEVVDSIGRTRAIILRARDGKVTFSAPPGEGGIIKNPRYAAGAFRMAAEAADRQ